MAIHEVFVVPAFCQDLPSVLCTAIFLMVADASGLGCTCLECILGLLLTLSSGPTSTSTA